MLSAFAAARRGIFAGIRRLRPSGRCRISSRRGDLDRPRRVGTLQQATPPHRRTRRRRPSTAALSCPRSPNPSGRPATHAATSTLCARLHVVPVPVQPPRWALAARQTCKRPSALRYLAASLRYYLSRKNGHLTRILASAHPSVLHRLRPRTRVPLRTASCAHALLRKAERRKGSFQARCLKLPSAPSRLVSSSALFVVSGSTAYKLRTRLATRPDSSTTRPILRLVKPFFRRQTRDRDWGLIPQHRSARRDPDLDLASNRHTDSETLYVVIPRDPRV